ncbi:hypothetical protein J4E93_002612 [Alternaria ventricosa]|uniref:uncharacterized protein n=1 Tax=Alternaria ventricosa TaxID=1187951 RepID=UPI0020C3069B|nr:uncharacterized protein J4E93_002612 [Alternaria ventricosa]KAI4652410.1 hypothetical protein J4E93_002612 [Alternaria ventricosa]
MSAIVVRHPHSSWYTPTPGQENRNIAAEAYRAAIEHLKNELGISLDDSVPHKFQASIKDVFSVVENAKKDYEDKSKQDRHAEMRQSLERLSARIMYYGKVIDTLAQHHPEYVALVWGAMKFVLTVGYTLSKLALPLVVY